MDHFDNDNLDFMGDLESSNMPDGFAWADVKGGIYAKQKRKKKFMPMLWWTSLGLLILMGTTVIWYNMDSAPIDSTPVNQLNQEQAVKKDLAQSIKDNESKTTLLSKDKTPSKIAAIIPTEKIKVKEFVPNLKDTNTEPKDKKRFKKVISGPTEVKSIIRSASVLRAADAIQTDEILSAISTTTTSTQTKHGAIIEAAASKITVVAALALIELTPLDYEIENEITLASLLSKYDAPTSATKAEKTMDKSWTLSTFFGGNIWNSNYSQSNALGQDRNRATEQLIGFTTSLSAEKMISKNFFIGLEASYLTWNNKFESSATRMFDFLLEDVVLIRNENSLTGSVVSETVGDVTVPASQFRYVKHYNKFNALRLGAVLGYKIFLTDKLNLDLKVSSAYLLATKQEGRSHIDDLDILDYNNSAPIYNTSGFGIQHAVRLNYMLTSKIGIGIQMAHEQFLGDQSADDQNLKLGRTDIGATINYKL